jgi:hypothetical protein
LADIGERVLPAVNGGLRDFKAVLEAIRAVIPGTDKWKVGTRALEGAGIGATWGAFGGPLGVAGGALAGGAAGGALGAAENILTTPKGAAEALRSPFDKFFERSGAPDILGIDRGGTYTSPGRTGKPARPVEEEEKETKDKDRLSANERQKPIIIETKPQISLSLNIDGRTTASAMSTALASYYAFPGQAPAADGLDHFNSGDHNFIAQ